MKQIIMIHGGGVFLNNETFFDAVSRREYKPERENRKKWKNRISEQLEGKYEIFKPEMPSKENASYKIRKLWFEKIILLLNQKDTILIGHSLGAMFLIKYIGENGFPKSIKQLHLVSGVFDESEMSEDEKYAGDFAYNAQIIPALEKYAEQIFIYHSTDDNSVPYSHAKKIGAYLPKAKLITFSDRGHINQPEFPELLENILG